MKTPQNVLIMSTVRPDTSRETAMTLADQNVLIISTVRPDTSRETAMTLADSCK